MPGHGDFELEIKKAAKIVGELIEKNSNNIGYSQGVRIALEGMIKEMMLGKARRAQILTIETKKLLEKERRPPRKA